MKEKKREKKGRKKIHIRRRGKRGKLVE